MERTYRKQYRRFIPAACVRRLIRAQSLPLFSRHFSAQSNLRFLTAMDDFEMLTVFLESKQEFNFTFPNLIVRIS